MLSKMPEGELKIYSNNGSTRWYYSNGKGREYLSREGKPLAEKLAKKKYLLLKRDALLEDKENIENRAAEMTRANEKYLKFLTDVRYYDLLSECSTPANKHDEWANQNYNQNPHYPEQLTALCPSGNVVRSKSEVFIDMVLNQNALPYRYECELVIGKHIYYPDFTILCPNTKEIIYWEHLGKMDNPEYARNAFNKLRAYYEAGLIPGKNLILTFESKDKPFSYDEAAAALTMMRL